MNKKDVIVAYRTGSQLWATNPKDKDYLVVVKDEAYEDQLIRQESNDYFVLNVSEFKKYLSGQHPKSYCNIVCMNEPIYGKNPYEFDWFAVKEKALDKCSEAFFMRPDISSDGKHCHKHVAWALWLIYAIENNSIELTGEQKANLCKCHDKNLDRQHLVAIKEYLLFLMRCAQ